jgi:hypothetical protein
VNQIRLRKAQARLSDWIAENPQRVMEKEKALSKWGAFFHPDNVNEITADGVREFLTFKSNKQWAHIQRHAEIYGDMRRLRECLTILLDESEPTHNPIDKRLDLILPRNGAPFIKGLGMAVLTPILMCVYPRKYAVYNKRSIEVLQWLQAWRESESVSMGANYLRVNEACTTIAKAIKQPLPLVDLMFGLLYKKATDELPIGVQSQNPDWAFMPEFEGPKKRYRLLGAIEAVNNHGAVVNALHAELKAMGRDAYRTKAIDLFLTDGSSSITHVFEVKTDHTTTSLYQAVGQAMWHGALRGSCPRRIVVLPGKLAPDTETRMKRLAIEVLHYEGTGSETIFGNLLDVLASKSE